MTEVRGITSLPSPPSWLLQSQSGPRTTFAPTNMPFIWTLAHPFLCVISTLEHKPAQTVLPTARHTSTHCHYHSPDGGRSFKPLEQMCEIVLVRHVAAGAQVIVVTTCTLPPHAGNTVLLTPVTYYVLVLHTCNICFYLVILVFDNHNYKPR